MDYGKIECLCAAEYVAENFPREEFGEPLALEYANHVGFMTAAPYIRQAIADLGQRVLNQPLVMPIIRCGDIWFGAGADDPSPMSDQGAAQIEP